MPKRGLLDPLPSAVVEHQEIDGLRVVAARAAPAVALLLERQPPKIEPDRIAIVDRPPEMVVLAEAVEGAVEVAPDPERHRA